MYHIVLLSGGHSSALVAIEVVRKYGKGNVILLNHDINPMYEDIDIKRFKRQISEYLGVPITYANIRDIVKDSAIPSQFEVCVESGALTDQNGNALCTSRLKTEPFYKYLNYNFNAVPSLFEAHKDCIIYYGFDKKEKARIQRRSSILGAMGYKSAYILATWEDRTIFSTNEIGIVPPLTYDLYEHANCKGCLKASLLHWYVVYVNDRLIYNEGIWMENELDYTIHTIIRDKVKQTITLIELGSIFEEMHKDGVSATEHQSKMKFAALIRKYQIEEIDSKKPCECISL